ncbi:MAG: prepilin peptidase [Caldisericaceae bacterium]
MRSLILIIDYYRIFFSIVFFALGAIIGSFLNVVIYRLPKGESIVYPPSHCTHCGHKLAASDLIPIFSYIYLKGRCRYCNEKISIVYPIVEAITGITVALLFLKFGFSLDLLKYIVFACILIVIAMIDLNTGYVYDSIVIPSIFVGLAFSFFTTGFKEAIFGAIFYGVLFFLIILISKLFYKEGGMGEGDLTAGIMIGAFLGLKLSVVSFILSFIFGSLVGILIMIFEKKDGETQIPFVPYLAFGAIVSVFLGGKLISFYLQLF